MMGSDLNRQGHHVAGSVRPRNDARAAVRAAKFILPWPGVGIVVTTNSTLVSVCNFNVKTTTKELIVIVIRDNITPASLGKHFFVTF